MINLLPNDVKSGYRFARRNVVLRTWVILMLVAIVGLMAIISYGAMTLQQSTMDLEKNNAKTEELFKQQKYAETQNRVKEISNSFKLSTKVLSNEVLFSKLLTQIGTTIPKNGSLSNLSINQSQSAIDITADVADYATATQLQVNLADRNNKIFSKADIISIACDPTTKDPDSPYPCSVNIRALFAPNNPYLLINSKEVK